MKVVFAHLGAAKAPHLIKNIAHVSRLFPAMEITLILSPEAHTSFRRIKNVTFFEYQPNELVSSTIYSLQHNRKFRKGFWFYSLERIYALRNWSSQFPEESFLHIESDILLMADFPIEKIFKLDRLAWTRHSEGADVATFIFSPNHREIDWVTQNITSVASRNPNLTDMSALAEISKKYPDRVVILPSDSRRASNEKELGDLTEYFGGIFDPAAYGMWLTGQDPRNNLGLVRRFLAPPGAEINPAKYRFKAAPLGTLQISSNNYEASLFNLHVHSKRLSLFGPGWSLFLYLDVINSRFKFLRVSVSPRAMWAILSDFHFRHGLFTREAAVVFLKQFRALWHK